MRARSIQLGVFAAFSAGMLPAIAAAQTLAPGSIQPNFTLPVFNSSQQVNLYSNLAGKIVVLDFFAYWCEYCNLASSELEPQIQQYFASLGGNPAHIPVQLVSVNVNTGGDDLPTNLPNYISQYGLGCVLNDPSWSLFNDYNQGGIPQFAIIDGAANTNDKQWQVVWTQTGYSSGNYTAFRTAIDSITLTTPTNYAWTSTSSTAWGTGSNWNGGVAPSPGLAGYTLTAGSAGTQGSLVVGGSVTLGQLTLSGGTSVTISPTDATHGSLVFDKGGLSVAGLIVNHASGLAHTDTVSAPIALNNNLDVAVTNSKDRLDLSGPINGGGALVLCGSNLGTVFLSGSDTYSGGTIVDAGVLDVTSVSALPRGTSLTVAAGGTLILGGSVNGGPIETSSLAVSPCEGITAVPEPGTLALLSAAGIVAAATAWRKASNRSGRARKPAGHFWRRMDFRKNQVFFNQDGSESGFYR